MTLSSKYQLVVPREARERLALRPGAKLTVVEKGGVLHLIPERQVRSYRGLVKGVRRAAAREKQDRL